MVWTLPAEAAELQVLDRLQVDGNTISPYGGVGRYENLLIYSEAFDDATSGANWAETNMAGTANSTAAPNGTTTADTLTIQTASPGQTQQVVTTTVTLPYAFSVWAKSGTTTDLQLEVTTNGTGATTDNATFVLTSSWQRYSVTKSAGAGTSPTTVTARIKSAGAVGQTLYVWGAQLEQAASPGVYVRSTSATVAASQGAVTDGVPTGTTSGTVTLVGSGTGLTGGPITTSGTLSLDYSKTLASALAAKQAIFDNTDSGGGLLFEGTTADAFQTLLTVTDPTADRTITLPDATGTVALTTNNLSVFAATTSAQLAGVLSDETGSGAAVFATSPTLTTPTLGVATATTINKVTLTAPATGSTLTIADGKTLTANNSLTFAGTDGTTMTFPGASDTVVTLAATQTLTNKTIGSTGLTFSGAATDITTGTNEHLAIMPNGTGNVGIGTTSPQAKLHVSGGALAVDADQRVSLKGAPSSGDSYMTFDSGNNRIRFYINGTEVARLKE